MKPGPTVSPGCVTERKSECFYWNQDTAAAHRDLTAWLGM